MKYTAFLGSGHTHTDAVNQAMVAADEWNTKKDAVITSVTPTETQACDTEGNVWHTYTLLVAYREVQPVISPWHTFYNDEDAAWVIINRESKEEIAIVGEYINVANFHDQTSFDAKAKRYAQLIAAAPQMLTLVENIASHQPVTQATIDTCAALVAKIHN